MTAEQLEAFSNTKPELRYLTEEIIKYLNANPSSPSPGSSYLVYTALLSQSGTDAPSPYSILENTIGDIVWTRDNVGNYIGTLAGAFTSSKTVVFFSSQNRTYYFIGYQNDSDTVYIQSSLIATQAFADSLLDGTGIEIRVYP